MGSFVISWSLWNYKFLMVIFSDLKVTDKFDLIETKFTHSFWPEVFLFGFAYPLITSGLYLFAYPFIAKPVFEFVKTKQNEILNIDKKLKDERLLSVEESRKIRAQLSILQSEYYQELSEKEKENEALKEEINHLQGALMSNEAHTNIDNKKKEYSHNKSDEDKVLELFAHENEKLSYSDIIEALSDNMHEIEIKYLIDKLLQTGLLIRLSNDYLRLSPKGRQYIVENNIHILDIPF